MHVPSRDSTKVPVASDGDGRTWPATMGGRRGPRVGLGWHQRRGACHRSVAYDDHGRLAGIGSAGAPASGRGHADSPARRRSQAADRDRPGVAGGVGILDRAGHARRPRVAAALDLQEHPSLGRGTDGGRIIPVGPRRVAALLHEAGYSLQANRKTREGAPHPDRNAQFEYINRQVRRFQDRGQPAISVDTKKKELVGDFKNAGREWRPQGQAARSPGPRLPGQDLGQGDSLRRLRSAQQRRLGERGHRPRHGPVCGQQHPPVVEADGPAVAFPKPRTC